MPGIFVSEKEARAIFEMMEFAARSRRYEADCFRTIRNRKSEFVEADCIARQYAAVVRMLKGRLNP